MSDEYGYFGSGDEGYAHYVAATGEDGDGPEKSGGGGGRNRPPRRGCGDGTIGCLALVILFLVAIISEIMN